MDDSLEVSRSVQFVSLDTHPANQALVVTYEILVSIVDSASGRELSRRNKRAQQLIRIREFEGADCTGGARIDLGRLSSAIIERCPMLASNGRILEDIQLHLLYLINRRQSSLLSRNQEPARPASSSAATTSARPGSRLQQAGRANRQRPLVEEINEPDIYSFVRMLEAKQLACCPDLAKFEEQFNAHLDSMIEAAGDLSEAQISAASESNKIDTYLEGLYGNRAERLLSLAIIRRLCGGDDGSRLAEVASNRLLICALMRNLRDTSPVDERGARELILACLLRLTQHKDVYLATFETGTEEPSNSKSSIDLVKILSDLLAEHIKGHSAALPSQHLARYSTMNNHYYLAAILAILINLFKIGSSSSERAAPAAATTGLEQRLVSQQDSGSNLGLLLCELLQLNGRELMRQIRVMAKPTQLVQLLQANVLLLRHLSCLREFIQRVRCKNHLFECIINLLNCLQLSRPGSGNPTAGATGCHSISDKSTLNELYHLELNLLMLVNNLLLDSRIKAKFIKRKLLRPVLRNLVIFFATTTTTNNSTDSTVRQPDIATSLIVLVPFRSLYELSCDKSVRLELYRSRIIMKCLLEYLLTVQFSANNNIEASLKRHGSSSNSSSNGWMDASWTISVEPTNVSHYILGVWINLSSLEEAPIFHQSRSDHLADQDQVKDIHNPSHDDDDEELSGLLGEYVDLALDGLSSSLLLSADDGPANPALALDLFNLIYLHLKLLRNCSQFMRFTQTINGQLKFYWRFVIGVSEMCNLLFDSLHSPSARWNVKPYLVECLACLSNLIAAKPSGSDSGRRYDDDDDDDDDQGAGQKIPSPLASIVGKLFQLKCEHFADEEDDDLLLVAIRLIGFFANKLEICHLTAGESQRLRAPASNINQEAQQQQQQQLDSARILRACNFVLDSKQADYELLIHTLYSLGQLMNHARFLKTLLAAGTWPTANLPGRNGDVLAATPTPTNSEPISICDDDDESPSNLSPLAELLVDKLASLVHSGASLAAAGGQVRAGDNSSRLALELVNLFRQLEQQTSIESSFVHKIRFANYNSKWLAAIQASREALEWPAAVASASSARLSRADRVAASPAESTANEAASWFGAGELLFGQQDSIDDDDDDDHGDGDDFFGDAIAGKRLLTGQQLPAMLEEEDEDEDDDYDDDDDGDANGAGHDFEHEGGAERRSESGAPDLNVIDANSMIKHLSSRRQLRQQQQRRQLH